MADNSSSTPANKDTLSPQRWPRSACSVRVVVLIGLKIAKAVSALDIGQTVVIKQGTVLAVEGFEGTDECIRRGGTLAGDKGGAVVVKVSKPNQDFRFDIPCIGQRTMESCRVGKVALARKNNCVLQVGHIERFNPVMRHLNEVLMEARFIEVHRLSPYPGRSTDIGVVLDLMIHDLDVVPSLVKSKLAKMDAVGIPVLSDSEDIANARLKFKNGCVANITARRVSAERMRKIRIFGRTDHGAAYISLDYMNQVGELYRVASEDAQESGLLKKLLAGKHASIISEFDT